jgi:small subunit ribosomal protein S7
MARRRSADKRQILPDSRYESPVVGRLISSIMERGKKSLAQRIVYGAIDSVNE